ncbi:hypothetical protein GCM10008956_05500 [Deinococcus arenae]|uniref:Lipoprotein n=1 Tax=Deinococcus arenae TaxID=1452751 RepID=A0A8H9L5N6_9DEIO|nr:hypothetical protein [Deinococcus arenae]GGM32235.1 hypothetical protein GCM10008956_05500 [Deinococcus arenae]
MPTLQHLPRLLPILLLVACTPRQASPPPAFQEGQQWLIQGEIPGVKPITYTLTIETAQINRSRGKEEYLELNKAEKGSAFQGRIQYRRGDKYTPAQLMFSFLLPESGNLPNTCTVDDPKVEEGVTKFKGSFESMGRMMKSITDESASKGTCTVTLQN